MSAASATAGLLLWWTVPFFAGLNAVALVRSVRALRAGGPLRRGLPFAGVTAAAVGLGLVTGGWMHHWQIVLAGALAAADLVPSLGVVLCHVAEQPPARRDPPPNPPPV